jgi:hypothetical protein
VLEERGGILVGVDVGLVGDVVALALEEANERKLPDDRDLRARERPVVGPVEGDLRRPHVLRIVELVQAEPAPAVVRLPGVHRHLDEDLGPA